MIETLYEPSEWISGTVISLLSISFLVDDLMTSATSPLVTVPNQTPSSPTFFLIENLPIKKQVGEDGVLFGTVTNGDVAEVIKSSTKKEIDRRDITVPDIHSLGSYNVSIKLHPEVSADINIEVIS